MLPKHETARGTDHFLEAVNEDVVAGTGQFNGPGRLDLLEEAVDCRSFPRHNDFFPVCCYLLAQRGISFVRDTRMHIRDGKESQSRRLDLTEWVEVTCPRFLYQDL